MHRAGQGRGVARGVHLLISHVSCIAQVLGCLHALHAHRKHATVHVDVKPENMLMNAAAKVSVGDFGLARAVDKATTLRASQSYTVTYRAPEILYAQVGPPVEGAWVRGCVGAWRGGEGGLCLPPPLRAAPLHPDAAVCCPAVRRTWTGRHCSPSRR